MVTQLVKKFLVLPRSPSPHNSEILCNIS